MCFIINVDAGFDEIKGSESSAAVIRDSSGGCITASHSFVPYTVNAALAEAYALKDGLLLAQQIGCRRVKIQSDCIEIVNTMQDGGFSARAAVAIYDECVQILQRICSNLD